MTDREGGVVSTTESPVQASKKKIGTKQIVAFVFGILIVVAILIFRVLTYGIQIPIGAFTYFIWRRKRSWMRDTPPPGSIAGELEAQAAESAAA
jgi:hypothetical protein